MVIKILPFSFSLRMLDIAIPSLLSSKELKRLRNQQCFKDPIKAEDARHTTAPKYWRIAGVSAPVSRDAPAGMTKATRAGLGKPEL